MVGRAATLQIRVLGGETNSLAALRPADMKTEMSIHPRLLAGRVCLLANYLVF